MSGSVRIGPTREVLDQATISNTLMTSKGYHAVWPPHRRGACAWVSRSKICHLAQAVAIGTMAAFDTTCCALR